MTYRGDGNRGAIAVDSTMIRRCSNDWNDASTIDDLVHVLSVDLNDDFSLSDLSEETRKKKKFKNKSKVSSSTKVNNTLDTTKEDDNKSAVMISKSIKQATQEEVEDKDTVVGCSYDDGDIVRTEMLLGLIRSRMKAVGVETALKEHSTRSTSTKKSVSFDDHPPEEIPPPKTVIPPFPRKKGPSERKIKCSSDYNAKPPLLPIKDAGDRTPKAKAKNTGDMACNKSPTNKSKKRSLGGKDKSSNERKGTKQTKVHERSGFGNTTNSNSTKPTIRSDSSSTISSCGIDEYRKEEERRARCFQETTTESSDNNTKKNGASLIARPSFGTKSVDPLFFDDEYDTESTFKVGSPPSTIHTRCLSPETEIKPKVGTNPFEDEDDAAVPPPPIPSKNPFNEEDDEDVPPPPTASQSDAAVPPPPTSKNTFNDEDDDVPPPPTTSLAERVPTGFSPKKQWKTKSKSEKAAKDGPDKKKKKRKKSKGLAQEKLQTTVTPDAVDDDDNNTKRSCNARLGGRIILSIKDNKQEKDAKKSKKKNGGPVIIISNEIVANKAEKGIAGSIDKSSKKEDANQSQKEKYVVTKTECANEDSRKWGTIWNILSPSNTVTTCTPIQTPTTVTSRTTLSSSMSNKFRKMLLNRGEDKLESLMAPKLDDCSIEKQGDTSNHVSRRGSISSRMMKLTTSNKKTADNYRTLSCSSHSTNDISGSAGKESSSPGSATTETSHDSSQDSDQDPESERKPMLPESLTKSYSDNSVQLLLPPESFQESSSEMSLLEMHLERDINTKSLPPTEVAQICDLTDIIDNKASAPKPEADTNANKSKCQVFSEAELQVLQSRAKREVCEKDKLRQKEANTNEETKSMKKYESIRPSELIVGKSKEEASVKPEILQRRSRKKKKNASEILQKSRSKSLPSIRLHGKTPKDIRPLKGMGESCGALDVSEDLMFPAESEKCLAASRRGQSPRRVSKSSNKNLEVDPATLEPSKVGNHNSPSRKLNDFITTNVSNKSSSRSRSGARRNSRKAFDTSCSSLLEDIPFNWTDTKECKSPRSRRHRSSSHVADSKRKHEVAAAAAVAAPASHLKSTDTLRETLKRPTFQRLYQSCSAILVDSDAEGDRKIQQEHSQEGCEEEKPGVVRTMSSKIRMAGISKEQVAFLRENGLDICQTSPSSSKESIASRRGDWYQNKATSLRKIGTNYDLPKFFLHSERAAAK